MREKSKTQSARHSESAIVCCAATKANNDFVRATIRGVQNHFASAECICPKRITFRFELTVAFRRLHSFPSLRVSRLRSKRNAHRSRDPADRVLCIATKYRLVHRK